MTTFLENIADIEIPLQIFEGGHGATNAKQGRDNLLIATYNAKNFVIGGNFDTNPWQRGIIVDAVGDTVGSFDWPYGSVGPDKFFLQFDTTNGGAYRMTRALDGPSVGQAGFKVNHCLDIHATTAGTPTTTSFVRLGHAIEGLSGTVLSGYWTLSFWVKSSVTGTYSLSIGDSESALNVYLTTYTVNSANVWEQKNITIPPMPFADIFSFISGFPVIYWNLLVGSAYNGTLNTWNQGSSSDIWANATGQVNPFPNNTNIFRIALIQAEIGITPTTFEVRSEAEELRLCQRFYEKSYIQGADPGTVDINNAWLLNPSIKNIGGSTVVLSDYIYMTVPKWFWGFSQPLSTGIGATPVITFYDPGTGAADHAQVYKRSDGTIVSIPVFASTDRGIEISNNVIEMQTLSTDSFLTNARFYVHWTWAQEPGITLL